MIVYTVTKIFGIDAVKTRVFKKKEDAEIDIQETINLLIENPKQVKIIEKENEEKYYIINKSSNPKNYIEFVLRRNEVR